MFAIGRASLLAPFEVSMEARTVPAKYSSRKKGRRKVRERLKELIREDGCTQGERAIDAMLLPFTGWWRVVSSKKYQLGDRDKGRELIAFAVVAATGSLLGEPLIVSPTEVPATLRRGLVTGLRELHLEGLEGLLGHDKLEKWSLHCANLFADPVGAAAEKIFKTRRKHSRRKNIFENWLVTVDERIYLNAVQVMRLYLLSCLVSDPLAAARRESLARLVSIQVRYPLLGLTEDRRPVFLARDQ